MALSSLLRIRRRSTQTPSPTDKRSSFGENGSTSGKAHVPNEVIKRATRLRRSFVSIASFSYLLAFIFLLLVVIGNTSDKPVLRNIYFFKLDLSNLIPSSVANASLINSIAQSIGLHDFYQVGLWNFCEGYDYEGITSCSVPQTLYWFNPVEVIMNELLAGATIALPTNVIQILNILRIASQIMFGFFITGTVLTFVMIFVSPLALQSRWWSMPLAIAALVTAVLVVAASIIGSVISFVFKYAAEAQSELNISADVGTEMLVLVWLASGFSMWAFTVHAGLGCCCVSKRDIKTGRREIRGGVVQDK